MNWWIILYTFPCPIRLAIPEGKSRIGHGDGSNRHETEEKQKLCQSEDITREHGNSQQSEKQQRCEDCSQIGTSSQSSHKFVDLYIFLSWILLNCQLVNCSQLHPVTWSNNAPLGTYNLYQVANRAVWPKPLLVDDGSGIILLNILGITIIQ